MSDWFAQRTAEFAAMDRYAKPDVHKNAIKMDSNENHVIPRQVQDEILAGAKDTDIREYPLGQLELLTEKLARHAGVPQEMIGVGNGSDQILDIIIANYAKGRKVLTTDPTFDFFEKRCKLYGIKTTKVPFSDDMRLDPDDFAGTNADIMYLDSPNNPTGFQFKEDQLQSLVRSFPGMVVIDEAYGEFGSYSVSSMAKKQDNLIVVRTLSKSFGLAGLRIGYLVAGSKFAGAFMNVLQYPYPLSSISIQAGIAALDRPEVMQQAAATIKQERARVAGELARYGAFDVFDSDANFVLFDAHGPYKRVYAALAEQGIAIRKIGKIGAHQGCLRVTISTKEANSKFLLAVRDLLE